MKIRQERDTSETTHDNTNKMTVRPAKTQISLGIRPVWTESSLSAGRKLGCLATHWWHSEDSDHTGRMPRLFCVFAGRTGHFVGFVVLWLKSTKWSVHPEWNNISLSIRPVWSDSSLCTLWVTKNRGIRLCGCQGWLYNSLVAHVIVFLSCSDSTVLVTVSGF